MKQFIFSFIGVLFVQFSALSQESPKSYPQPAFHNEIYFFDAKSTQLLRLEKIHSKPESKTKLGGFGGGENSYFIDGSRSNVRLQEGQLSFIFYLANKQQNPSDSVMKSNGMDLSGLGDPLAMLQDPSTTTSLFDLITDKGSRKITLQSYSGFKLASKSKKESTRYPFSVRKIENGYELTVDKAIRKGEYAFLVNDMTAGMDGSAKLFAFGVD
jgi:hypothetical protein